MYHEPRGMMNCPICCKTTPHEHSGLEVHEYHLEQREWNEHLIAEYQAKLPAQKAKRDAIQKEHRELRENKIKALQNYDKDHPCDFCRDLENGSGNGEDVGLIYNGSTIRCPECNKCFWSDEH